MVKVNKIILASLVSAFGFAFFSSAGNYASAKDNNSYTSTALATKFGGDNSGTDSDGFISLHTKIIPTDIRKSFKKSDGSYYKATKNGIKFDDLKHGYHGYISKIKDIRYTQLKGGIPMYFVIAKGYSTEFSISTSKYAFVFTYPVGKKEYTLSFNK